ncbi:MAG: LPXTG cell wall anchor domain-containing protein, partial [Lachnospiraceae bacterium]|nr:LPXTG cell wall anchor domain-containing protein [Lachnospiraceae bacterium]
AAKTGDSANPVVPAAAGMVALLGVWFVWKKK